MFFFVLEINNYVDALFKVFLRCNVLKGFAFAICCYKVNFFSDLFFIPYSQKHQIDC